LNEEEYVNIDSRLKGARLKKKFAKLIRNLKAARGKTAIANLIKDMNLAIHNGLRKKYLADV